MSLSDLDELVLSCRNEDARNRIAEAVTCYKAGAYRACIVATWIAVVYDLLEKIRELALAGDSEARKITNDISTLQPRAHKDDVARRRILEIENTIVDVADKKFGFFESQQVVDLNRLRNDRHRCAHPTYQGPDQSYSPTAELARTHLVHAIHHVVSMPPVQGKVATTHIIKLVQSNFFPIEHNKAQEALRLGGLERPKDSLVRSVIDQLIIGLFEGDASLKYQKRTAVSVRAVHDLFPDLCRPRISKQLNSIGRRISDLDIKIFWGLQKHLTSTWDLLEQDNQQRLTQALLQSSDDVAALILPAAVNIPEIEDACKARIEALKLDTLGNLLQTSKHSLMICRAVDVYCSSKSWDQANANYKVIEPIQSDLSEDQVRRIIFASSTEGADLNGAHSFSRFVTDVYCNDRIPKDQLLSILRGNNMNSLADTIEVRSNVDEDFPF